MLPPPPPQKKKKKKNLNFFFFCEMNYTIFLQLYPPPKKKNIYIYINFFFTGYRSVEGEICPPRADDQEMHRASVGQAVHRAVCREQR